MPLIKPGQRALAAGRTGSGKSTWANWELAHSPQHWVILNPKHTAAYKALPDSAVVKGLDLDKIDKALPRHQYVIVNPDSYQSDPDTLDEFIMRLHSSYTNLGLCVDELYAVHKSGVAGRGLVGWLTRGRELKQSFLGLTQRPAWLSKFLFSESDYICGMTLSLPDDRKRMVEMTGRAEFASRIPARNWMWYDVSSETLKYFGPVPIDF